MIVTGDFSTDVGKENVYNLSAAMPMAGLRHSFSPAKLQVPSYHKTTLTGTRLDYQLVGGPAASRHLSEAPSCEIIDDYTETTGHCPIIGRYKIVTEGVKKKYKAINPTTLSDVKLGQKDKAAQIAQLLQDLVLPDDLDARLEFLTDSIVRCAQLAFPPKNKQRKDGWSPTVREITIALEKIKLFKCRWLTLRR